MAATETMAEVKPAALAGTSRVCVKNIPKYVDEKRLREHFAAKGGEVTDVKVVRTKSGESRQMGFIGFRSVAHAEAALKYFDRTFMDTCRLAVEYARKVGEAAEAARPWSRHSDGSSAHARATQPHATAGATAPAAAAAAADDAGEGKKKVKRARINPVDEAAAADPKLAEFLALMQPRSKARLWSNDELLPGDASLDNLEGKRVGRDGRRLPVPTVQVVDASRLDPADKGTATDAEFESGSGSDDDEYQEIGGSGKAGSSRGTAGNSSREDDSKDGSGGRKKAVTAAAAAAAAAEASRRSGDGSGSDGDEGEDEYGGGSGSGEDTAVERDDVVTAEAVSDLDYLRSRMRTWDDAGDDEIAAPAAGFVAAQLPESEDVSGDAESGSEDEEAQAEDKETGTGKAVETVQSEGEEAAVRGDQRGVGTSDRVPLVVNGSDESIEPISETGRLFIRNLAYTATEADISELFGAFGDLQEVHLVLDRESKRSRGVAYVLFRLPEDAVKAHAECDGTIFQGRLLHVLPAKRQPPLKGTEAAANGGAVVLDADINDDGGNWGLSAEDLAKGATAAAGGATFKKEREAARKADAGNRAAWNTLFMRPDTVAEAVAAHYGVTKAELLDRGAADLPVRMALGEAHVLAATKAALAEAGVAIDRLESAAAASGKASGAKAVARSTTVLLVKNLPYSTEEEELSAMFGRVGPVGRLVLPPTKTLALVEYLEPSDARSAFRTLAYKKFQHVPLYLEWAPADIFVDALSQAAAARATAAAATAAATASAAPATATGGTTPAAAAAVVQMAAATKAKVVANKAVGLAGKAHANATESVVPVDTTEADDGGDEEGAATGTLFVKNLAFSTTDEALRKHFDKVVSTLGGSLHSARVARRKGPDGGLLSMGYGFVECSSEEVAKLALKKLQGSSLEKHKLVLQLSKRKAPTATATATATTMAGGGAGPGGKLVGGKQDDAGAKLVVRNVAFEATRKDIAGLFSPFGHMKSCRLPKKFDGSHRGFAFVEFVTKQEARSALEGVGGTHLYGRRLVVEYAAEEGGLQEVRDKTAAKFRREEEEMAAAVPGAKRLRKQL